MQNNKFGSVFTIISLIFVILFVSQCDGENELFGTSYQKFREVIEDGLLKPIARGINAEDSGNVEDCKQDLLQWMDELTTERWAIEMLDAGGSPPYGFLKGNINSLGQYDECVEISHKKNESSRTITGKYCIAKISVLSDLTGASIEHSHKKTIIGSRISSIDLQGVDLSLAVCMPASCKSSYIEGVLESISKPYGISIKLPWEYCNTNEFIPWTAGEIVALTFFAVIIVLLIGSTSYDLWFQMVKKGDIKTQNQLLTSYSVYTNSSRLTTLSKDPGPLACIHGIRVISLLWVILGHRYGASLNFPLHNAIDIFEWIKTYSSMWILSSSVAVDTFFLLGGLLLTYTFFRNPEKKSFRDIPMFYVHRILRLTPVMGVMILLQATLMHRVGSGPLWRQLFDRDMIEPCKKYWWSTLLYVQNYVNYLDGSTMCLPQTWYLSVDMQLYIISPLLLFPILKHAKLGLAWAGGWTVASLVWTFVICYQNAWLGAGVSIVDPNAQARINYYYEATHTRATPWLVGLLAGYFLRIYNPKDVRMNKIVVAIGWLASIAVMLAVVYGNKPLQETEHEFSYWSDTTYLAFSRTAWVLAVLWVICACAYGYGGPINWFLSLRFWEFLARLTYSMYLIHLTMINILISIVTTVGNFSNFSIVHLFLGDVLISVVLAYFMVLAFESPITILEKIIFKTDKKKPVPKENLVLDPEHDKTS